MKRGWAGASTSSFVDLLTTVDICCTSAFTEKSVLKRVFGCRFGASNRPNCGFHTFK
jgi:hypothetical protein